MCNGKKSDWIKELKWLFVLYELRTEHYTTTLCINPAVRRFVQRGLFKINGFCVFAERIMKKRTILNNFNYHRLFLFNIIELILPAAMTGFWKNAALSRNLTFHYAAGESRPPFRTKNIKHCNLKLGEVIECKTVDFLL